MTQYHLTHPQTRKTLFRVLPFLLLGFILFGLPAETLLEAQTDSFEYEIIYEVDRSGLPALYFEETTLGVAVGNLIDREIRTGEGERLPGIYDEAEGMLYITTSSDLIRVRFETKTNNPRVGSYAIPPLKDNKQWAWSHGLDDNRALTESIELFERREWAGTLFLIGSFVEDSFDYEDVLSPEEVIQLLDRGWSLGNHTYDDPYCFETDDSLTKDEEILRGQALLREIIAESEERSDYVPISFGAPCFSPQYDVAFNKLVENVRPDGSIPLYNESQGVFTIRVDSGDFEEEIVDERPIVPFELDAVIGRDGRIDGGNVTYVLQHVDWVSRQSDLGVHLWYNSLSHGPLENTDNEDIADNLDTLIEHIYREYGPWGTDEVWVAPSDAIYSYLLIREKADFAVDRYVKNGERLDPGQVQKFPIDELRELESIVIFPTVARPLDTPIPIEIIATPTPAPTPIGGGSTSVDEQSGTQDTVIASSDASVDSNDNTETGEDDSSGPSSALRIMVITLVFILILAIVTAIVLGFFLFKRAGRRKTLG